MLLRLFVVAVCAACTLLTPNARAHSASSSYLTIAADGSDLRVRWEIALRDLDYAIGLDSDDDGDITWGELRAHKAAVEAYAFPRLTLGADGRMCSIGTAELQVDLRGDGGYAVLLFTAACPARIRQVTVRYGLMFDLDPMHRGLLNFISGRMSNVAALSPAVPEVSLDAGGDLMAAFGEFFRIGLSHIFSGLDHLLFVAVLLLPAMFRRAGESGWQPVERFRPAFIETVRILTAFTVAHALTVTLASLEVVSVPTRLVEGAIALTIVVTAVDNIVPILPERRWLVAFSFGLIHGLGFASALGPLSLPALATATALLSFNLGVEAAQLLVAVVVLPLGFALRNFRLYPARLLPGASGVVAVMAFAWFADRAFGWKLGPF